MSHRTVGYEALTRFDAEPHRTPDVWFGEATEVGLGERLEVSAIRAAVGPAVVGGALVAALAPFRAAGGRLAVDDAGAGFASLRHILLLNPDIIKLDIALTRDIDTDVAKRSLATALIAFATETGATILAEGIETESELQTLRALGVRYGQGWHLGRPGPLPG